MRISDDTKIKLQQVKIDHRLISLDAAILHIIEENTELLKRNEYLRQQPTTGSRFGI